MSEPVIRLRGVDKEYRTGEIVTPVLFGIDLTLGAGEFVALVGPSGSGKSTLLNLLGLLDRPTAGRIWIASSAPVTFARFAPNPGGEALFPIQLDLPLFLTPTSPWPAECQSREALSLVAARAAARPTQLSGGEQQRVAVARALMRRPPIVLADEPTGNLDTQSATVVFDLLRRVNRERGTAFLIVTHDVGLASRCDRCVTLVDGRLLSDEQRGGTKTAASRDNQSS